MQLKEDIAELRSKVTELVSSDRRILKDGLVDPAMMSLNAADELKGRLSELEQAQVFWTVISCGNHGMLELCSLTC
jgi:hypothetical protein